MSGIDDIMPAFGLYTVTFVKALLTTHPTTIQSSGENISYRFLLKIPSLNRTNSSKSATLSKKHDVPLSNKRI